MPEDLNALESVWRNATLRPLVAGRLFASVAEWMWYTVATVYAFTLAGVGAVGAIGVAAVFPAALLSPGLGYVIDRFPRERVLAAMLALRFVALTVAAVSAAFFPSVAILVAVAVAEGIASLFVRPTTAALLPSVTRRPEDLVRAHAALGFADNVGVLVGPVCGGLILAGTTPDIAFATAAALALGSFVAAIRVRVDVADLVQLAPAAGLRHALTEATRGARDVAGRDVRSIALVTALAFAVVGGERSVHRAPRDRRARVGRGRTRPAHGLHRRGRIGRRRGARRDRPATAGAVVRRRRRHHGDRARAHRRGAGRRRRDPGLHCVRRGRPAGGDGKSGAGAKSGSVVRRRPRPRHDRGPRLLRVRRRRVGYDADDRRLVDAHQPARPGRGHPDQHDWAGVGVAPSRQPGSRRHANASAPSMGLRCSRRCRTPCANGSQPSSKSWTSRPTTS